MRPDIHLENLSSAAREQHDPFRQETINEAFAELDALYASIFALYPRDEARAFEMISDHWGEETIGKCGLTLEQVEWFGSDYPAIARYDRLRSERTNAARVTA